MFKFKNDENTELSRVLHIQLKTWVLSMLAMELFISLFLYYRQYSHTRSIHEVPRILTEFGDGIYTSVDLDLSRERLQENLLHNGGKKMYTAILWMIMVHTNGIYLIWKCAEVVSPHLWPDLVDSGVGRNMAFALLFFVAHELAMFPLSVHANALRAKQGNYRESKRKASGFVILFLKEIILNAIVVVLASGLFCWILNVLDKKQFQDKVVIITSISYLYILLYPSFEILSLINEHKNSSQLKSSNLVRLCHSVGFPKKNLFLFQGGFGIPHDIAFFFGFLWLGWIVVFHKEPSHQMSLPHEMDTILTSAEIEAIVAHELGHYVHDHSNKDLLIWHAMHISTIILTFWIRLSKPEIFQSFGLPVTSADLKDGVMLLPGVIIAYCLILRVYFNFFQLCYYVHQHACENQADKYATLDLHFGKQLGKALIKISIGSKTFPSQDPWYSLVYHNHPSLVTRLHQISNYIYHKEKKNKNKIIAGHSKTS